MSNAKLLEVVDPNAVAAVIFQPFFDKGEKSSLVAEMSAFINREITDVKLINASVRVVVKLNIGLIVPACRVELDASKTIPIAPFAPADLA